MTAAGVGRAGRAGARERPRQRGQLQHPLLSAPPARPRGRRGRRPRRRPLRDRPLLPGLAAPRHRLELAARARQGRRAAGGRRHRLALARPDGVRDRAADRRRSWPTWRRSSRPARSRRGPVETFSTERSADTVARPMATEDVASILLRFGNGARGVGGGLADQRRPQELAPVGDRRLDERGRAGTRETPDHLWLGHRDRPERDPPPQPGADGPGRSRRRRAAGRPRRGLRRHVRRAVPGDLRRRRSRAVRREPAVRDVRRRPRRDARQRRDRRRAPRAGAGSTSIATRRDAARPSPPAGVAAPGGPRPDEARLADRAVPRHAARRGRRLGRRQRLRGHRDRLLADGDRADPALRRHVPHRRREPVREPGAARSRRDRGEGPRRSPASASTRTRSIPIRSTGRRSSAT